MNDSIRLAAVLTLSGFFTFPGLAAAQTPPPAKPLSTSLGVIVFPAKGQTAQQQSQDEGECFAWSKTQTGFDPMNPTAQTPATPPAAAAPPPRGQRVRGAARGAAAGAIIGEVANDDASEGAAVGATVGALRGGAESRRQNAQAQEQAAQQQQQAAANQQAAVDQQSTLFKNGFQVCLESKGYTVK
jgi:uncharacterized protein YcfJ